MCVEEMYILHFLTILFEPIVYFGLSEVLKNLNLLKFFCSWVTVFSYTVMYS